MFITESSLETRSNTKKAKDEIIMASSRKGPKP